MPRGKFQRKTRAVIVPIGPSIAYVPLTQGQFALIDAADVRRVAGVNWFAFLNKKRCYYAKSRIPDTCNVLPMHVYLMGAHRGTLIDHRNGNSLDNRRVNLRPASTVQNRYNTGVRSDCRSGMKGVRFVARLEKWQARFTANGKRESLGVFFTKELAANAYRQRALEHAGEFARFA
jgi:hypothetical protein